MEAQSVGFVGLGVMGRPMAENLAKRFLVEGFDTLAARLDGMVGVKPSSGFEDLGRWCQVICLSLPSAAVVESVILGDDGLLRHLSPGSLILDLSTGLPAVSRKLAEILSAKGIAYADSPVSGGEGGAKSASLSIMVGASESVFARALPYLQALGSSVVRAGEVGAGNVAKLVNNMIVGVAFSVIAEGFALAVKNGLDPAMLHLAIRGGWAGSPVLEVSAPSIAANQYRPGGTIDMIQKDLGYAALLAKESGVNIPMTNASREIFSAAQQAGWGAESQPAVYKLWAPPKEGS